MDRLESVILIKTLPGGHPEILLDVVHDSEPLPIAVSGDVVVGEVHEPLDQVGQTPVSGQA